MRRTLGCLVLVVAVAACGSKKSDKDKPAPGSGSAAAAPGSAAPGSAAPGSNSVPPDELPTPVEPDPGKPTGTLKPTVDLALGGSVTAALKGTFGTCTCHDDNANITLRSDDFGVQPSFDINILVTSPEEWTNPALIINVKAPQRGSYGRNAARHGPDDKLSVARDCSQATIEKVVLKGIATKGEITVHGTITCAP